MYILAPILDQSRPNLMKILTLLVSVAIAYSPCDFEGEVFHLIEVEKSGHNELKA